MRVRTATPTTKHTISTSSNASMFSAGIHSGSSFAIGLTSPTTACIALSSSNTAR